jgi:putative acetyltransferase
MTQLRLRPEGPADVPAIRLVLAEAFAQPPSGSRAAAAAGRAEADAAEAGGAQPVEVGLVDALRDSPAWLPDLSMVAEADGVVVGYALLSRVTVGESATPALALGPVAVRPANQNSGYGTATVRAALDAAAELGEGLVLVLGEPAYYGRFGFEPASAYGLSSLWSGPHYRALVLPGAGSDGLPRGAVRYPQPWLDL